MSEMATKSRPLTIKQKKFVKAYVANDGNGTRAALAAFDTTDYATANVMAQELLQKPSIRDSIEAALVRHEITMDAAIKPIAEGLKAEREIFGDDGSRAVADHTTRLRASSMALRLLGADQQEPTGGNVFNLNYGQQSFIKSTGDAES